MSRDNHHRTGQRAATRVDTDAEIVIVRPEESVLTRQLLPNFVGISAETAGATGISMHVVIIPAGAAAEPHLHRDHETAIFLLKGSVATRYGPGLKKLIVHQPGDFIFIPANVPHQAINLSDTEPAYAVVARNHPEEQENVVAYRQERDA